MADGPAGSIPAAPTEEVVRAVARRWAEHIFADINPRIQKTLASVRHTEGVYLADLVLVEILAMIAGAGDDANAAARR